MREVIYYVADDGTQFEDESECREYEWQCGVKRADWTLLSDDNEILPNDDYHSYDNAHRIFIPTCDSADRLAEAWDDEIINTYCPEFLGYCGVTPGLWVYDDDRDEWYHVGERIAELQDMANEAMEVINNN